MSRLRNDSGVCIGKRRNMSTTDAVLIRKIRDNKKIAPKGFMPAYSKKKISSAQLSTLAAYLASLK
jgi:hypothetical protein